MRHKKNELREKGNKKDDRRMRRKIRWSRKTETREGKE
jgi:hypothetical protein